MHKYYIYMPIDGMTNIQPYLKNYGTDHTEWELVSTINADNLYEVFYKGNHFNKGVRSLSVGDIVVDESGKAVMCDGTGWKDITFNPLKLNNHEK